MNDRQEIRCFTSEKDMWRDAAGRSVFPDLSSWMRYVLNKAAHENVGVRPPRAHRQEKVFT